MKIVCLALEAFYTLGYVIILFFIITI